MGFRPLVLLTLPLLLTSPSLAQQQEEGAPVFNLPRQAPPTDPSRQGPELDVYRGAPVQVTPPPVVAPTVTPPPPVVVPQPTPQPATPQPAAPAQPAPTAGRAAPPSPAKPEVREPAPTPDTTPSYPVPPPIAPEPAPRATETPSELAPQQESGNWPWIAAGAAAFAALLAAAWLLLRRKSARLEEAEDDLFTEEEAESAPPAPAPRPQPVPPRQPPPSPANDSDRAWIELEMEVRGARLSLMGATIDYTLTLHNRGNRAADDLLIRTLIANADAHQQQALQQFFAGTLGLPSHSVVSLAPGESHRLTGQLRLLPDQIAPVQMGERSLLIPLVAFDAQYRWKGADRDGHGRSARAFIVGQEKSPPADRLTPFRLDMGPRQFRTPGSRATALELAS